MGSRDLWLQLTDMLYCDEENVGSARSTEQLTCKCPIFCFYLDYVHISFYSDKIHQLTLSWEIPARSLSFLLIWSGIFMASERLNMRRPCLVLVFVFFYLGSSNNGVSNVGWWHGGVCGA